MPVIINGTTGISSSNVAASDTVSTGPAGIKFADTSTQTTAGATGVPVLNVLTSSGTWTKPATVKAIKVTVLGGGGTPSSNPGSPNLHGGRGGGAGGYSLKIYPAPSLPGPQPYTVGAAGGTSSFGVAPVTVISATGGTGGTPITSGYSAGAAGGVGTNGDINIVGETGGTALSNITPDTTIVTGAGAPSQYGAGGVSRIGGPAGAPANSPGDPGSGYGSGGSGGRGASATGGTGAPGVVIVEEFY